MNFDMCVCRIYFKEYKFKEHKFRIYVDIFRMAYECLLLPFQKKRKIFLK